MRRLLAPVVAAAALVAACDDLNPPSIDPFPIPVSVAAGPLRAGLLVGVDDERRTALIDTLSPLSVIDTLGDGATEVPSARRVRTDVTLLAACDGDPGAGCDAVARARFDAAPVLDAHTCGTLSASCAVGLNEQTASYRAILGADLLSQTAMLVDLRSPDAPVLQFAPDIAGSGAEHCIGGAAVLPTPLAGGATLLIDGGESAFAATRVPLRACLAYAPAEPGDLSSLTEPSGTDALLLLTTGLGPTVLTESAYARYRLGTERDTAVPDATAYELLPVGTLQLPSGTTDARVATVPRLSLVGRVNPGRGPCEERRASRLMRARRTCDQIDPVAEPDLDPSLNFLEACPCRDDKLTCKAGASISLDPDEPLAIAILPDEHPVIQALRDELRPEQPEVDGLLGLTALLGTRFTVDYTNRRMLLRCGDDPASCLAITEIDNPEETRGPAQCPRP